MATKNMAKAVKAVAVTAVVPVAETATATTVAVNHQEHELKVKKAQFAVKNAKFQLEKNRLELEEFELKYLELLPEYTTDVATWEKALAEAEAALNALAPPVKTNAKGVPVMLAKPEGTEPARKGAKPMGRSK